MDIGGTNVRYGFAKDLAAKEIDFQKKPFTKIGNPYIEVEENIIKIIEMAPSDIKAIGISLAAIMDRKSGKVKTWPNNKCWNHYELIQHLNDRYDVPIFIEDDANCGAIGEYYYLSDTIRNMAYITIGTGIGCGLILNGSLYIGNSGFAGELGHICIEKESNNICSCGSKGCFQAIASGSAVLKNYVKSSENIIMVIFNLVMCLDVPLVIIGGGVINKIPKLILDIENKVNERLKYFERKMLVQGAKLGEFSGTYGALQLLKNEIYKGDNEL